MKTGILTFHRAINAGAVLQAFAMQETLKRLGYDASIVDYAPSYIDKAYNPIRSLDIRHPRGAMYELSSSLLRFARLKKYRKFWKEYFNLSAIECLARCEYAILGSDQIWNSSISGGNLDPIFFNQDQRFNAINSIAYAASTMSVKKLTSNDLSDLASWLPKISAIGVREKSLGDFLNERFGRKTTEVIDPTLLAPKDIYNAFLGERVIDEDYLLFYEVWHNDEVEQTARRIAKNKGLKFIGLSGSDIRMPRKDILQIFSPDEFVNLVANASHIVTSSFHGTAFSLIFEKQFNVVCEEPHQAVRMQELLEKIGYSDKFSYRLEPVTNRIIDYVEINEILNKERIHSLKFLSDNLK